MEACDQLRSVARQAGFSDRTIFHADASFDWGRILMDAGSMSLFAEKKFLEIRLPSGKPGSAGSKALEQLATQQSPDTLVMVVTGKLDAAGKKSRWYRAFESNGVCLQLWPLKASQLPAWIRQRMRSAGMQPDDGAVSLLAERVEGNLLAADQEIQKLKLLASSKVITAEEVAGSVADSSRHNAFELVDTILQHNVNKLSRMLGYLRAEGTQVPAILWVVARELRLLFHVSRAFEGNRSPDQVMNNMQVWKNRQSLVSGAARRKSPAYWQACLARCARIDRMIKGRMDGNPWDELLQLSIRMARN